MKLAFSTNAFKRYSLEDSVKEIAKIGYEGVEILCDVPHAYPPLFGDEKASALKKTLAYSKMKISNLNAFTLYAIGDVYRPSWIDDNANARYVRVQHTIDCLRIAKKLGAGSISTEPGGPLPESGDPAQFERMFSSGLNEAARVAEEEGVYMLVEPEPGLLIENSEQFTRFMKGVRSDRVRLNFDIGHFYCVNEDPARLVHELSDHIGHFHLADIAGDRVHNHLIPGRGSIDFRPIFDAMDDVGYNGFVTVELYPYQENPVEAAREAHDHLCSII